MGDFNDVFFGVAAGGESRGAEAEAGGVPGFAGLARDGIFIGDDPDFFQGEGGIFARPAAGAEIDEDQMFISPACHDVKADFHELGCENLGIFHDLVSIHFKIALHRLVERYANAGDGVVLWAALDRGEDGKINSLSHFAFDYVGDAQIFAREDERADGAAKSFSSRHSNDVGMWEGTRVGASGDESRLVGDVGHVDGPDRVGDDAHLLVVDLARVGGATANEDFRLHFLGNFFDVLVVKNFGHRVHGVEVGVEEAGGETDGFAIW